MTYLKIWWVFIILTLILWASFYTDVINAVKTLVAWSNQGFISLLPIEAIAFISILSFWLLMSLAFAVFRE